MYCGITVQKYLLFVLHITEMLEFTAKLFNSLGGLILEDSPLSHSCHLTPKWVFSYSIHITLSHPLKTFLLMFPICHIACQFFVLFMLQNFNILYYLCIAYFCSGLFFIYFVVVYFVPQLLPVRSENTLIFFKAQSWSVLWMVHESVVIFCKNVTTAHLSAEKNV